MKVRTNLKILRDNRGLSQRQLEQVTGIPHQHISNMENGLMIPTDQQLLELCKALETTYDFLYPDPELRKVLSEQLP